METKILVLYINVINIRSEDIPDYVKRISEKVIPSTFVGEVITLPVQFSDTRIECINPKYITNLELINEHTKMMIKLQEELKSQEEILKQKKYE